MDLITSRGSTAVIVLDELSFEAGLTGAREQVRAAFNGKSQSLIVDLSRIERPSSTMFAWLLWAHRCSKQRGGRVVLRGLNRSCKELLARAGILIMFDVRDRQELGTSKGQTP